MKLKISFMGLVFLMFGLTSALAQEKDVSGTVTDLSNMPLPGASIVVKGSTRGVSSDFDGNYTIKVNQGDILVFSFIGYTNKEVTVGASNTINVQLEEDAQSLQEVVVTAFGKPKPKREMASSVAILTNEDLTDVTNTNPFESLSGKIAGVDISTPAQNGATSKVIIRGFSSLGSNQPLYIVDGSPINNTPNGTAANVVNRTFDGGSGLNDIDPNSIENITVLKGAAASALYGSRASNGVILITTKRGKAGQKLRVDVISSLDYSEVARVPHLQNQFGQGWNGQSYSSLPTGGLGASNENGSWGAAFDGKDRPWGQIVNNSQQIKPYVALENNIKDFYDVGYTYTNSVRLYGGGESSSFSFGFTNTKSDGIIPTDSDAFDRNAFTGSGSLTNGRLTVTTNANYIERDQNIVNTGQGNNAGEGEVLIQEIIQIPRDISLIDLEDYVNNPFNNNDNYYTPYSRNPYWTINENKNGLKSYRFFGNVNLSYAITENLKATYQLGADIDNVENKSYGAVINYTPGSPNDLLDATPNAGGVTETTTNRSEYDTFLTLDYNGAIAENFSLDASIGTAYNQRTTSFLGATITDLSVPNFYELSNTAGRATVVQNDTKRRTYGIFGSATVGYKERYFLTLTARNDWTSTLPIGNNSYFYPSAGLSAIVMDNGNHFIKLRTAIAQVAKDTGPYNTENALIQGVNAAYFGQVLFPIGGQNAFELSGTIGNPNLKPEITTEFEIGTEMSFFNNRVSLDAAVYNKDTEGVIILRPLPRSTGFANITGNYLDLNNKGIELTLNVSPIRNDNFDWRIGYTFTKNENEVTDIAEGLDEILINGAYSVNFYAIKGKPLGVFKTRTAAKTPDGQVIVNPDTGIPVQTTEEQEIGTSQRDFIMGLKNTLSYKRLTLSFNFDWKQGGKMYSYTNRLLGFTGNSIATTYNDRNPFIVPNSVVDNGDGTYSENTTPISYENITGYYSSSNNGSIEESHVIDRSFIRLRDLSLAYSVPSSFSERLGLNSISMTLYGKNLFLWTPDENPYVDPEISTFGSDLASEFGEFSTNPSQRTYGFALKVSF